MTPGGAPRSFTVVGAGWAGLAAAVALVERGAAVRLLEMAPAAGGRARRLAARDAAEPALDNGQHIAIGAYAQTLALMRTVGVDPDAAFLRTPLALVDAEGDGLVLGRGRTDLAFARAVLARRGWTWHERFALLRAAFGWQRSGFGCDPALTVEALAAGLPARVRRDVVEPLCVAALNTAPGDASAAVFLRVLRDAFAEPGGADLLLPRVDLSAALVDPALAWLARHGADVRLGTRVRSLERVRTGWRVDAGGGTGGPSNAGAEGRRDTGAAGDDARATGWTADAVVLACSPTEAARLAAPHAPAWAARAGAFAHEPIVTVYARSDGTRLPAPMLQLASDATARPAQYVFDRGALGGPAGLLAFVVSGAAPWVARGTEPTERAVLAQAAQALGPLLRTPLAVVRTVVEKRATFRCTPGLDRPPGAVAPGLVAAGDYVEGPYPSTLEGAVRSGGAAAAALV